MSFVDFLLYVWQLIRAAQGSRRITFLYSLPLCYVLIFNFLTDSADEKKLLERGKNS